MREADIDPSRNIRTLIDFQHDGPFGGGWWSRVINPSSCRLSNPSWACGASTPVTDVSNLYVWTPRRRYCIAMVLIGRTRRGTVSCNLLPLHWRATMLGRTTPTLLPLHCASRGNDPWSSSCMRSLLNAVQLQIRANIAFPFPNSDIRVIIFSFWSKCAYRDMLCLEYCNLFIWDV